MLTLYHYWSSVCSQKVRLCLCEIGLDWESRHVDLFRFENYDPEYLALNPNGVVPTLVHDGRAVIESTIIDEYLADRFDAPWLRPEDPYARARMRLWTKHVDEAVHPAVATASVNVRHRPRLAKFGETELLAMAERIPDPARRHRWLCRARDGIPEAEEKAAFDRLAATLDRMEAALAESPWLAGKIYSLADIAMAPYANRIEALGRSEWLDDTSRPGVARWWECLRARAAYDEAFSFANPEPDDPVKR